jgi:glutamyl-tRNA synthetase
MTVVTRFAPSPTGFLHIGNARTALFSYLFAKHNNGKFLLRIEDTDRERSTEPAIKAIYDGLKWLGIEYDGEALLQSTRSDRHAQVAHEMINRGKAYKCFHTSEELEVLKQEAQANKAIFRSKWRDVDNSLLPNDKQYVVRLKSPDLGETIVNDLIQGKVVTKNSLIEDTIILRSDLTPTYMLAVVVDDHDMGVTHIIRGDDHLTNTTKQILLYQAMDWKVPEFAHLALIHGPDGAKLSKRHGALGVMEYKNMGFLPETMRNYLLRLGFSHGNDEIISDEQAIEWFDLKSVGKSPSRLDFKKIESLNSHYIKHIDNIRLLNLIGEIKDFDYSFLEVNPDLVLNLIKSRTKTVNEVAELSKLFSSGLKIDLSSELELIVKNGIEVIEQFISLICSLKVWDKEALMSIANEIALEKEVKLGQIAEILRVALTGMVHAPSIFDIMAFIGKDETIRRLSLWKNI